MNDARAWQARRAMVREQIEARGVKEPDVLAAMRTVPRHAFVREEQQALAYRDRPLPIGHEQTISQPYIVAAVAELLQVTAGDRVLEVGSGCGYQAAVLAEIASEVYGIERLEPLLEDSRERLHALGYRNVHLRCGDGYLGWPEAAPFDGIVVSCGAPEVPPPLLQQLALGRRLVVPVGPPGRGMKLQVWTRESEERWTHQDVMDVRFVPLIRGTD